VTAPDPPSSTAAPPVLSLPALFGRFLLFGALAFGGPVAQIAMIRRELVEREGWIASDQFNRLLAVMQALPGPEAHELCVHLGIRARGRWGGVLAGLGFMLPGFCLMLALAYAYTRLHIAGSVVGGVFMGVQAAVLALIVRAVHRIGQHVLADRWLWLTAIAAAAATLADVPFWIVLPTAGLAHLLAGAGHRMLALAVAGLAVTLAWWTNADAGSGVLAPAMSNQPAGTLLLFWAGLKGGLLTFGGAYTAIPFVRADTVQRGWMSDAQFLDGLGLSGLLPAPLVIFVTFVGYVVGGLAGALAITAGMFLPAFGFSLLFYERLEQMVEDRRLGHALAGIAAAVVGLIAVTWLDLARTAVATTTNLAATLAICAVALIVLYRFKHRLTPLIVVAIGAAAGLVVLAS
jgi:chromate transporter